MNRIRRIESKLGLLTRSLPLPKLPSRVALSSGQAGYPLNSDVYEPLLHQIQRRRLEARRSVLVQVAGKESSHDLASYCARQFGPVERLFYYNNKQSNNFKNFIILQFQSSATVEKVLREARHFNGDSGSMSVPVYSPFLWLHGAGADTGPREPGMNVDTKWEIVDEYSDVMSDVEIRKIPDLSRQIFELWQSRVMTETSSRMRFLVCHQVELALSGMFPNAQVLPFGSSVNGFGSPWSDQDMHLTLDSRPPGQESQSRLVFHAKGAAYGGDRAQVQRYCEEVAKIVQTFLPGCQDVQKILGARVPIIKYSHQLAGLECDLSMSSSSGLHMSCLLHLWAATDWRLRPLVSLVRRWASAQGLVKNLRPTPLFTNFTLTMLVVCYLMEVHKMLPTVQKLETLSRKEDLIVCEDQVTVSFLHDINGLASSLNSCFHQPTSLSSLLQGFFHFYASLDMASTHFCPLTGGVRLKDTSWHNSSGLDITNPIEKNLNVSYNVSRKSVDQFQLKASEAASKLAQLAAAEDQETILNDGIFWLFSSKQETGERQQFVFPSIVELGLSSDSPEVGDASNDKSTPKPEGGNRPPALNTRKKENTAGERKQVNSNIDMQTAQRKDKFFVNSLFRDGEHQRRIKKSDKRNSDKSGSKDQRIVFSETGSIKGG